MGFYATIASSSMSSKNQNFSELQEDANESNSVINELESNVSEENMAPALTEPLSQSSKLSSSTTLASPRPTSNIQLANDTKCSNNNNGKKITKEISSRGAFQQAFEQVIARQVAAREKLNNCTNIDNNDLAVEKNTPSDSICMEISSEKLDSSDILNQSQNTVIKTSNDELMETEESLVTIMETMPQNENQDEEDTPESTIVLQISKTDDEIENEISVETNPTSIHSSHVNYIQEGPVLVTNSSECSSGNVQQKDFIKDSTDMEQVLGELATSEMDLLQVLKGLDTTTGGLCDLAGNLGLFNDVDVINYEEISTSNKDIEKRQDFIDIKRKQQKMQRKCDFLLRRLKKLEARSTGNHTSEEVAGLFEWTNRMLKRKDLDLTRSISYDEERSHSISMGAMRTFLKRIDSISLAQHSYSAKRVKLNKMYSNAEGKMKPPISIIPRLDDKTVEEIDKISGMLQAELKVIQKSFDSDATASSSGGESADEMVTYNNSIQQPLSINKRAAWRWNRDRCAIASRWTWLMAQISDLEYRIKQHNELHLQIKKSKGAVIFEKANSNTNQNVPSSVNGYRGVLPGNTKPMETDVPPNGAFDSANIFTSCRTKPFQRTGFRKRKLFQTASIHIISKIAARTSTIKCGCRWPRHPCALCTGRQDPTAPRDLPDTMTFMERVSLLDPGFHPVLSFSEDVSTSIHLEGKIKQNDWQTRLMRCANKISKGSVHNRIMDKDERSKKCVDSSRRKFSRNFSQDMAANKSKSTTNRRHHPGERYNHIKKKHQRKLLSSSVGTTSGGGSTIASNFNSNTTMSSSSSTVGSDMTEPFDSINCLSQSKNSSPVYNSSYGNGQKHERYDKKIRHSYDIDNVVIPYSVSAATRVEILPYKEIPTPKWRVVDNDTINTTEKEPPIIEDKNTDCENSVQNPILDETKFDEFEDISDETIQSRHDRALVEERKKFQTYLKFPWSTRSRANRRIDSRAESSGANTPDPTSPQTPNPGVDQESIPSPAAATLNSLDIIDGIETIPSNQSHNIVGNQTQTNVTNSKDKRNERRRTVSSKKDHMKDESSRGGTPDLREVIAPYEPLSFPLADDVFEKMLKMMPNEHQNLEDCIKSTSDNSTENGNLNTKILVSNTNTELIYSNTNNLLNSSSETESVDSDLIDEDPNDPEWRQQE